jgi:HAD superfamily hydrolase (TIGR01509 family)
MLDWVTAVRWQARRVERMHDDPAGGSLGDRRIEAVVFDMDGTLLDSSGTVPAAYAAAIHELCGRECSEDEIIAAYSVGPAGALISSFTGRDSTDGDLDCWHRHVEQRLHLTTVYEGVAEALDALRAAGLVLGVFTGATLRAARAQLAHTDLASYFDVLVGSDEIERVKPAPDGLLLAATRLGVAPDRLAYVGDALDDLRCARTVGAMPVAAAWGHLHEPDDEPHIVARDPRDLVALAPEAD